MNEITFTGIKQVYADNVYLIDNTDDGVTNTELRAYFIHSSNLQTNTITDADSNNNNISTIAPLINYANNIFRRTDFSIGTNDIYMGATINPPTGVLLMNYIESNYRNLNSNLIMNGSTTYLNITDGVYNSNCMIFSHSGTPNIYANNYTITVPIGVSFACGAVGDVGVQLSTVISTVAGLSYDVATAITSLNGTLKILAGGYLMSNTTDLIALINGNNSNTTGITYQASPAQTNIAQDVNLSAGKLLKINGIDQIARITTLESNTSNISYTTDLTTIGNNLNLSLGKVYKINGIDQTSILNSNTLNLTGITYSNSMTQFGQSLNISAGSTLKLDGVDQIARIGVNAGNIFDLQVNTYGLSNDGAGLTTLAQSLKIPSGYYLYSNTTNMWNRINSNYTNLTNLTYETDLTTVANTLLINGTNTQHNLYKTVSVSNDMCEFKSSLFGQNWFSINLDNTGHAIDGGFRLYHGSNTSPKLKYYTHSGAPTTNYLYSCGSLTIRNGEDTSNNFLIDNNGGVTVNRGNMLCGVDLTVNSNFYCSNTTQTSNLTVLSNIICSNLITGKNGLSINYNTTSNIISTSNINTTFAGQVNIIGLTSLDDSLTVLSNITTTGSNVATFMKMNGGFDSYGESLINKNSSSSGTSTVVKFDNLLTMKNYVSAGSYIGSIIKFLGGTGHQSSITSYHHYGGNTYIDFNTNYGAGINTDAPAMRICNNKKVILGTIPTIGATYWEAPYHLVISETGASNAYIQFVNSNTTLASNHGTLMGITTSKDYVINNFESGNISIGTSNTERVRITSNGTLINYYNAGIYEGALSNHTAQFYGSNNGKIEVRFFNSFVGGSNSPSEFRVNIQDTGAVNSISTLRFVNDYYFMSCQSVGSVTHSTVLQLDKCIWRDNTGTNIMGLYTNSFYPYTDGGKLRTTGTITASTSVSSFTGSHNSFVEDLNNDDDYIGLIVSSSKKLIFDIEIDNSWLFTHLTNKDMDKNVYGIIAKKNNEYNGKVNYLINSIGEGALWVCNINDNLEAGDLICSSKINGYGRKQDDDLVHNYTIAKITMDCDFSGGKLKNEYIYKQKEIFDCYDRTKSRGFTYEYDEDMNKIRVATGNKIKSYKTREINHNNKTYKAAFVSVIYLN